MAEILIVDDEIGVRELLTEVLQDEGHSVILAANGAEAREQKKRPSQQNRDNLIANFIEFIKNFSSLLFNYLLL